MFPDTESTWTAIIVVSGRYVNKLSGKVAFISTDPFKILEP